MATMTRAEFDKRFPHLAQPLILRCDVCGHETRASVEGMACFRLNCKDRNGEPGRYR